ncbi:MAG: hypothetical protein LBR07_07025 [Puniceicoccales bacterium]|jgi:hypothetical protein|nr:hypothetical protein [Puniceicoccales bacterium]
MSYCPPHRATAVFAHLAGTAALAAFAAFPALPANAAPAPAAPAKVVPAAPVPATTGAATESKTGEKKPAFTPLPARQIPVDLLLLNQIPKTGDADVRKYADALLGRANAEVPDPLLRSLIRLSLAQISDEPARAWEIRAAHMNRIGNYFHTAAVAALQAKRFADAYNALQLATRCAPSDPRPRLLLADMQQTLLGDLDAAATTLETGMHGINIADAVNRDYYERYFKILEAAGREAQSLRTLRSLLKNPDLPPPVAETLNFHAAIAAFALGEYTDAAAHVRRSGLRTIEARLLEARALYFGKDTRGAIELLYKAAPAFRGRARDSLLAQVARFYAGLGETPNALAIATQRLKETPASAPAALQRLLYLDAAGERAAFDAAVKDYLARHAATPAALIQLATLASERARPELAEQCRAAGRARQSATTGGSDPSERALLETLRIEALVRAGRYDDALDAARQTRFDTPEFAAASNGVSHAILAAAYFGKSDRQAARRHLEAFTVETRSDAETFAKVAELRRRLDNLTVAEALASPSGSVPAERNRLRGEIDALLRSPRKIAAQTYSNAADLLRRAGADTDAMRLLESGVAIHRRNAQLLADFVSARIACSETAAIGSRRPLTADIAQLLKMPRPNPKVWTEIARWLATPDAARQPDAAALRAAVAPLVRPDLKGLALM